jgi:hypothetical protein
MISELKTLTPVIDFGLGLHTTALPAGQPVTVWLQALYNQAAYTFALETTGTVTKISNYQYRVTFATPGTYTIQLAVTPVSKGTNLMSNILDLTVTEPNG